MAGHPYELRIQELKTYPMAQAAFYPHGFDPANDPVNRFAQNIIEDYQAQLIPPTPPGPVVPGAPQPRIALPEDATKPLVYDEAKYHDIRSPVIPIEPEVKPIAIIGGGIGGLYAAYLLQYFGIRYTIYEASDRVGGRLHTYKGFKDSQSFYDYIDLGAMRFPDTPIMAPVFDLFDDLGLKKLEYLFEDRDKNSTLFYNAVRRKRQTDAVTPKQFRIHNVPDRWGSLGIKANMQNVTKPFTDALKNDVENGGNEGWKLMMKYDIYSTRAYMQGRRSDWTQELDKKNLMPYPIRVVEWCETFTEATSFFDRALTETVLDALAFDYSDDPDNPIQWYCIDGGVSEIAKALEKKLEQSGQPHELKKNKRVSAIRYHKRLDMHMPPIHIPEHVTIETEDGEISSFGHAITTSSLPCLRLMDLSHAQLDYPQTNALRSLAYTSAAKIGVKFTSAWWQDDALMKGFGAYGAIVGGQSFTDHMVRRVVYPSYGVDEDKPSTVLMVSYAANSDALPWTGLTGEALQATVRRRVINDLVGIHGFNQDGREYLEANWEDHVLYSWNLNPNVLGSWAVFYPGEFKYLYTHLTRPAAKGRLHFAGEVVSARHGWVVGALEASKRAVYEIVCESYPEQRVPFEQKCGRPESWTADSLLKQVAITLEGLYPIDDSATVLKA
ncbi:FAD-dependent oxidoreductase [Phanerochaete sordida]|uniref:FAD-dependent oxidoreductase n=1 Tax=Phanerochaete sordida TaxID=48140 RepID=A0A9P3LFT3_9APHY|nr:FAD-dependent oxidoreductase [Phanerochaete sordida]